MRTHFFKTVVYSNILVSIIWCNINPDEKICIILQPQND
jgi:hypothetical protein